MDKQYLDSLMVKVMRTGDEDAFAEFYQLTKNGLFAYLLSVVKHKETAEDIMQDAYIQLRRNVQSYTAGTNPFAFLTQIAKNIAFNQLRRAKYETAVDYSEWEPSDGGGSVEKAADTTVLDAIKKNLSDDEAQIVMLHLVSGFKHREIAEITGRPVGTVLWSYNNSLKKLKKVLKEDYDE